jgi:hypothetical protein
MTQSEKKILQGVLGVEQDGIIGPITREAFADSLIEIASRDVGIFETSKNHGAGIAKFWESCDYSEGYRDRAPYCAAAVTYWVDQMGAFSDLDRPRTAAAFGFEGWGRNLGLNVSKTPSEVKRGDLVILRISHVGIATSDSDRRGAFTTIEANTSTGSKGSQRDGGGVYRRTRNLSSLRSAVRI